MGDVLKRLDEASERTRYDTPARQEAARRGWGKSGDALSQDQLDFIDWLVDPDPD